MRSFFTRLVAVMLRKPKLPPKPIHSKNRLVRAWEYVFYDWHYLTIRLKDLDARHLKQ